MKNSKQISICDWCKHGRAVNSFYADCYYSDCYNCVGEVHSSFEPTEKFRNIMLAHGYSLNKSDKRSIILMGFPGVGKTYVKEKYKGSNKLKVLDSDSSNFDKSDFPNNYIKYINEQIGKYDIIMVSTHAEVRDAIKNSLIPLSCPIYICYPSLDIKDEWLERLRKRGNNETFIKLIDENYYNWIRDIEMNENALIHIQITNPNGYLYDNLYKIKYAK